MAGGLNLYGFANGDPINFSDPFGLCPEHAGGDGKTDTADDCSREVLEKWASERITLGVGATWDGVEPTLRDAIIKASIELNMAFHVSSTTGDQHAERSFHYQGLAADISRVDGLRFGVMPLKAAAELGVTVGSTVMSYVPRERWAELITPGSAGRYYREIWSTGDIARLIRQHRSHVHVSILP